MDRVTKPQKKMLITLLRETKFIEGKKEKEWYWEKIQAALNTIGPKKTIIQWKKCWRDMRLTTRKKLAELKRCQLAGGSPPPGIELNQEDSEIIDIVGSEYFYEEMNGELKPESFISNFDYVPEHFCDTILTAASVSSGQQHLQQQKEQHVGQHQQDRHTNDVENNDAAGSSNQNDSHGGSFQTTGVPQMQTHNGDHNTGAGTSQQHSSMPQNPSFHGGLQSHFLRRQQFAAAALQRETAFEEKLLLLMQAAFPKKIKKRKNRDPDKLFLLSLYEDIKRIPEEIRLDVKCELIQVLKSYQKKLPNKERNQSHTQSSSSKHNFATTTDKIQLSHSMYQLQKKYEKNEKETSPQSQVDRVQHVRETGSSAPTISLHAAQQIPHSLYQLQKKFEENNDKVHQQNEQRKHAEASHQQQNVAHQPPPPSNEQHMHHTQMTPGILFPLPHPHNLHPQQPQQHPHQQQNQHHPPTIFGSSANSSSISTDRPPMAYENVG